MHVLLVTLLLKTHERNATFLSRITANIAQIIQILYFFVSLMHELEIKHALKHASREVTN